MSVCAGIGFDTGRLLYGIQIPELLIKCLCVQFHPLSFNVTANTMLSELGWSNVTKFSCTMPDSMSVHTVGCNPGDSEGKDEDAKGETGGEAGGEAGGDGRGWPTREQWQEQVEILVEVVADGENRWRLSWLLPWLGRLDM